jgi:hypothetical protein
MRCSSDRILTSHTGGLPRPRVVAQDIEHLRGAPARSGDPDRAAVIPAVSCRRGAR